MSQLLAGSELVHIDEDELLEELSALTTAEVTVEDEGVVVEIDGEKIELPSVPKDKAHEPRDEPEKEREKELIAE